MNPLQSRLAALRRHLRVVVTFRGVCWLATIALTTAAMAGLLDWWVPHHLPSLVRALILVGGLGGAGYVGYRFLVRPLWSRLDDLSLALRVEAFYPALNDSLASAVEFLEQPEDSEESGSPGLRRAVVKRTLHQVQDFDFDKVVSTRGVGSAGLSVTGATALAVVLTLSNPTVAWTALARLADPFGNHDWPRQTQLRIADYHARVARGEPYEIHALVSGIVPEHAEIDYEGLAPATQTYRLDRGQLVARLDRVEHAFKFQVRANDAISDQYEVAVLPPPVLVPLQGRPSPQVHLRYPAYTDLPEQDLPDGSGNIEAVAGTYVTLQAATDRPIARAWIEYRPEQAAVRPAAFLGTLGAQDLAGAIALTAVGQDVWDRVPVRIGPGGTVLNAEFLPRVTGLYALHFEDEAGLGNTRLFDLRIHADPAPLVNLERPSKTRDSLDVLPDAEITVQVSAEDKEFAVRSVYLEYRCKKEDPPRRLPLSGPQPLKPRPQQLQLSRPLALTGIKHLDDSGLQEGDVLTLQACADDFDDVAVDKQPGRSHEIELTIVSRAKLDALVNQAQSQVQQELLRILKMQQEAVLHVIGPEQRWRNTGKLETRDVDQLRQAEQLQQQVRARVGTKDEGLRAEVARILKTLHDNHLPHSGTDERMETVAAELDRLAREELEQIEPRLTNARKENEIAGDHPKPPPAGSKGLLGEARGHQEEVENTLNNLLKLLEPWGSVNEVKGETKALLDQQRQLKQQTDDLKEKTLGLSRNALDPDQKAALDQVAELQAKLAERTQQLLGKMGRLGDQGKDDEGETTKALQEAAKQGQDAPGQMKSAGDNIRDNKLSQAGDQQGKSVQSLEQMSKALEDRREAELDQLRKKLKDVENQLADLAQRQEELRKKVQEAAKGADPVKREQELKELARLQDQLRKEAQDMVKELTRLRADRAGQALSGAGGSMEQAGQKLAQGQDPQEPQDETLDRLKEAQRRLKQEQDDVKDELDREKLAKVADQIKLLKERQESAAAEMDRLQKEALQQKQWSRDLRVSLHDLAEVQKGLAQETDSLALGKLAGAKVFARILARSAESMKGAAEQMLKHGDLDAPSPGETAEDQEARRLQGDAVRRLAQLLDALKPDPGQARRPQRQEEGGEAGKGSPSKGAGDGIPPLAQLKVLRAMQQDVNQRTETFGKKHPDADKLTEKERQELQAIHSDQQEVADLLDELTRPGPEGGMK